jgi:hypothetical protein
VQHRLGLPSEPVALLTPAFFGAARW